MDHDRVQQTLFDRDAYRIAQRKSAQMLADDAQQAVEDSDIKFRFFGG